MDFQSRKKRISNVPSLLLVMSLTSLSHEPIYPIPARAFSFPPGTSELAHRRTACNAKLNKIASSFDLDKILSNEREFDSAEADVELVTSSGRRQHPSRKSKNKKAQMKEQLKRRKLERQKRQQKQSSDSSQCELNDATPDSDGMDSGIDHNDLVQTIHFLSYEVPSFLNGKRVDAALVDLLNEPQEPNRIPISRSQCETLLSNGCVYIVTPEEANDFRFSLRNYGEEISSEGNITVPYSLIEQHGSLVQRKAHVLESSSILIYPSRKSLLSSPALISASIPTEITAQSLPLDILYEDDHIIVINKHAGIVVHPAPGNWDRTVVNALAYYLMNESPFGEGEFFADLSRTDTNDPPTANIEAVNQNDSVTNSVSSLRPGIVHRLDKGTSGVLVVAKTSFALAALSEAFAKRKVKKQYLAIAIGNPGDDRWINKPIGRHPLHRQKMRVVPDPSSSVSKGRIRLSGANPPSKGKHGRPALSHIHTIHHDGKLSIVQVRIATGRTHQIRVHLQDHGTPIYGDDVYGLSDWNKILRSRKRITRPLLHAQTLEIEHPATGKTMVFKAPVPDDMMGVIKAIWPAGKKIEL